jgi:ubiquinol-cytochrome c reductase iron-sulfur subunit
MRRRTALLFSVLMGRRRRRPDDEPERVVGETDPSPRSEVVIAVLLVLAALGAIAFVVVYGFDRIPSQTQYLGLALAAAFALLAAAFVVASRLLEDEDSEEYTLDEPEAQSDVRQVLRESGNRFTRKRLLLGAGGVAGGSLGAALLAPAASLGPFFETGALATSAWKRGTRLVDERNRPIKADDIEEDNFYTAFPEHEGHDRIDAPLVVVRLPTDKLELPPGRENWAPEGLLAFSKICTHAGCAITLYRAPLFQPDEPKPALVCPCHYSTFDPATGGGVIFGPAGRPLPQLPLTIDPATRELRAGGTFSGEVGPSWWGVREHRPRYEKSGPEGVE